MADVVTAGTFVAAVLEEAGYLAQATFLKDFRGFFREAGALVYILGGIGGIVSLVLFGSFRAARYLLLGPALYWFLVGPTTKYDGVMWQLGGGAPRGLDQARGEAKSREDVNRALKGAGLGPEGPIEVATGFALFARPINQMTQGFVDLILMEDEDNEYLNHIAKGRALETLLSVQPDNPMLLEMLEGDFVQQCSDMVGYGIARAAFDLRSEVVSQMGQGKESSEARQKFYEDEFKKYRDKTRVNPGMATRAYYRTIDVDPFTRESIDCQEMWKLVASYLQEEAKPVADRILEMARGDNASASLSCERLLEKIEPSNGTGGGGDCNLQNVVALYMLRNAFMDRRASARFVRRLTDSVGEPRAVAEGSRVPLANKVPSTEELQSARQYALSVLNSDGVMRPTNPMEEYTFALGLGEMAAERIADEQERENFRENVVSTARMSAIGGPLDAGFTEYPRYHLRNLRQQLFTWSMQLPYWQGVLLYILAVAYPFMALIVLLPGRAPGFLNLPLAWLWVKSWDIGLAFVMVFERVLWNILPSLDLSKEVTGKPLDQVDLWAALSEAQKFDHTWNLHVYYICLAMATFSIPAVTGYATLRSRRAVLASFTEKLGADARDAGQRAAGAFGMSVMADRVRTIKEIQGAAYRAVSEKGEGLKSNGRGASANTQALMSAYTTAVVKTPGVIGGGKPISAAISSSGEVAGSFIRTANAALMQEVKFDREHMAAFHPLLGRYGKLAMMNEAYAAAMDGSGGFELNEHKVSPIDAYADLITGKIDRAYENAGRLMSVNPALAYVMIQATFDKDRRDELMSDLVDRYEITKFAAGVNAGIRGDAALMARGTPDVMPEPIDRSYVDKTFSMSRRSAETMQDALSHPDEFRKQFTFRPGEMYEDLPKYLQDRLKTLTVSHGLEWEGKETKGAGLFHGYTPPENWNEGDSFNNWRKANPGVGDPGVSGPAPSAGADAGSGGGAGGAAGGGAAAAPSPTSTSATYYGDPYFASSAIAKAGEYQDKKRRDQLEHFHALDPGSTWTEQSEKLRLANLNMDWLTGDRDEQEDEHRRRQGIPVAPKIKKSWS